MPVRHRNILIVDDEEVVLESLRDFLVKLGHRVQVTQSGHAALSMADETHFDYALLDIRMPEIDGLTLLEALHKKDPEMRVIMITAHGTMETVIQALRLGASDFLTKPVNLHELTATLLKSERLGGVEAERKQLRGVIRSGHQDWARQSIIAGESEATEQLREQIKLAASSGCQSIVITGETGTGKEVAARSFHLQAHDPGDPFIAVNCPGLPETLIESELFGHVKGAFTGAETDRLGAFELANGGTLFLDEVSDLSPAAQAKLLRAIETRTVRRVGDTKERRVQATIVAASNRDLEELVAEGKFRADLLFRLNVFNIQIDPLRERRKDILPLARHFLQVISPETKHTCHFSPSAEQLLLQYDYPGNIRELRNIVERAMILSGRGEILPEHLALQAQGMKSRELSFEPHVSMGQVSGDPRADQVEANKTLEMLRSARWNRRLAAERLGISYEALRWRIRKHHLSEDLD